MYIQISSADKGVLLSPLARVALVKCRDLHWAMMAHKDQKDTNLTSIRMLIVADGANPCELDLLS